MITRHFWKDSRTVLGKGVGNGWFMKYDLRLLIIDGLVFGIWNLEFDVWYLVFGIWYLIFVVCHLVYWVFVRHWF
jgi:hypothetical protein